MWYVMWKMAILETRGCCILKLGVRGWGRGWVTHNKGKVSHAALEEGCKFVVDSRSSCICLRLASPWQTLLQTCIQCILRAPPSEIWIAPIREYSLECIPRFIWGVTLLANTDGLNTCAHMQTLPPRCWFMVIHSFHSTLCSTGRLVWPPH